ncbi:uncharacterized protein LOC114540390 [Dendronephthya gigantea]|uniref:uncharacterized protein LOC114540390 n=1 Tax=Dendronephthya gigantea TaxID=151771 RepID=UPI00106D6019|nr:uncharacterized protein LOC114540390 [Dendronephthya gigantea]
MSHTGPNYLKIKETGITADRSSYTEDRLCGEAPQSGFKWIDRFSQEHMVKVHVNRPEVTVMFPVSNHEVRFRATGINNPGDELRTGFGFEHRWCEATFMYQESGPMPWQGEHVKGKFTFYKDNDISSKCTDWNKWEQACKAAKDGGSLVETLK